MISQQGFKAGVQSWVGSKPTQSKMEFVEEGSELSVKSGKQKRKFDTEEVRVFTVSTLARGVKIFFMSGNSLTREISVLGIL